MTSWIKKIFYSKSRFDKALKLLQECASAGDLQAQQVLNLYHSSQNNHFTPLNDNVSFLRSQELSSKIAKCLKSTPKKQKKKHSRVARNPKNKR
jgi:hypothetical protein